MCDVKKTKKQTNPEIDVNTRSEQESVCVYCHEEFHLSVVQLPVHIDLTLCDVTSQIRDGVSDI